MTEQSLHRPSRQTNVKGFRTHSKRRCEAHLLGFNLHVESLPFQEQDTAAAACATSAIWSGLQGTALLFQHGIHSPVEITRIATGQFPGLRRAFPNRGLNPPQMAAAIRQVGLDPEVVGVETKSLLKATVYAYLRARIPVLMNVALFAFSDLKAPKPYKGDWNMGHAVAVTGYSLGTGDLEPHPKWGTLLRATRIDRLYVHDDQLGPFARLKFDGPTGPVKFEDQQTTLTFSLSTSWPGEKKPDSVCFVPETLIVPVYHKIRVDFDTILEKVFDLERHYRDRFRVDLPSVGVEWDIYLTTASDFKADIRGQGKLQETQKWELLCTPFPRFLWIASGYLGDARVLDLVFDATDVPGSSSLQMKSYKYGL